MKQNRTFPKIKVTKKQEQRIRANHPWVYADEITEQDDIAENGCIVDVFGQKGNYLGSGLYSEHSLIRVRILGNNANEQYTDAFFERKVKYAVAYRKDIMKSDFGACRIIHGESDGLPGLTVDRYSNLLVAEVDSLGIDLRKDIIYKALLNEFAAIGEKIDGIYERNESELRKKEGLPQYKGWYGENHPASAETEIIENGLIYTVDAAEGQKTGFFLDQKYNRLAVRNAAEGKTVLDCCTHTGSFAMNAALGNAKSVTAMDISESALAMAKRNAERNHLNIEFRQGDVFEILPQFKKEHAHFDFIILDPPAFTKSRKTYRNARNGYREINAAAMRLLPRGGYLATNSCSHFMPRDAFFEMLNDAASDAGVQIRIIEERHASPDHPVLTAVPETEYLKFFLLQIL